MADNPFAAWAAGRPIPTGSIGGLSDLRLIDLNLFYVIKEIILPLNGYVSRNSETLTPQGQITNPETLLPVTYYQTTYNDLVYYNPDPLNPALTGLITVPNLSQSGNLAYIDYPNGIIAYSGTQTSSITAQYDYYSVYVQDGYPDIGEEPKDLEDLRVPLISIDFERRRNSPLALGGSFSENRVFVINITAANDPQRDDLMDMIETSLRYTYTKTIDYRNGFPIYFTGDKNLSFDRSANNKWLNIRFADQYSRVLRLPTEVDKLRHQGLVFITIETT